MPAACCGELGQSSFRFDREALGARRSSSGMATDDITHRLADLVTGALELGSGKYERDVADDLFRGFGLDLVELEKNLPRQNRQAAFRHQAAVALADAAATPGALMTEFVRCGGRFVAMVEEIYSLLADHASTSTGAAERFRLRRDDLDVDITISPAFIEHLLELQTIIRRIAVGRIDYAALHEFVIVDNGAFYGRWPLNTGDLRLLDAALHVGSGHGAAATRQAAAEMVGGIESLLRSYIAGVDALEHDDVHSLFTNLNDGERTARAELESFRAEGVLGGTAYGYSVAGLDQPSFLGLDRAGNVVSRPESQLLSGGPMSGLAQFIAIWRLGMHSTSNPPDDDEEVRSACEQATSWLRNDVLIATGSMEIEDLVERFEEFLNLPLWRGRQLLYEIWILCRTLRACQDMGWQLDLPILHTDRDEWVLDATPTTHSVAGLRRRGDPNVALEVWREPRRPTVADPLTPDVAIATPGDHPRDLVVVEAKDRYAMSRSSSSGSRSALAVARRYADLLHANATWVCNHCDFREGDADPATNYGDPWCHVHLAGAFRPGSIPSAFADSIAAALTPPGVVIAPRFHRLVLAVDMTASMTEQRSAVWHVLHAADTTAFREFRAVLFSDHGPREPYLVRDVGPCPNIAELQQRVEAEPSCHGEPPEEALEDAMRRCRELAEELGPVTVLVTTDAPPHSRHECPLGIDFETEVNGLLDTGSRCLVCDDWLGGDASWSTFYGRDGFDSGPLAILAEGMAA